MPVVKLTRHSRGSGRLDLFVRSRSIVALHAVGDAHDERRTAVVVGLQTFFVVETVDEIRRVLDYADRTISSRDGWLEPYTAADAATADAADKGGR